MPEHSAATDAWNDNPAATPGPPRRIVDGLTRKLSMMLKRSRRVRRPRYSAGTGSALLGAPANAMIFERPATAIAVNV